MRRIEFFTCDVCGYAYTKREVAEECELQPDPMGGALDVGDVVITPHCSRAWKDPDGNPAWVRDRPKSELEGIHDRRYQPYYVITVREIVTNGLLETPTEDAARWLRWPDQREPSTLVSHRVAFHLFTRGYTYFPHGKDGKRLPTNGITYDKHHHLPLKLATAPESLPGLQELIGRRAGGLL